MGSIKLKNTTSDVLVADFISAAPKGELNIMEHPYFSLTKKPDFEVFRYEHPRNNIWIEVAPSMFGRATIWDKDILLYCTGQIMEAINKGVSASRIVRITAYDYLTATYRGTGGKDYADLHDALARLRGTTFRTNLYDMGGREVYGLIDEAELLPDRNGKMKYIDVALGRRMFDSIVEGKILTYNQAYFTLSPYERRTYDIVRRHCGEKPKWHIGLDLLYAKFGTRTTSWRFKEGLKNVIDRDNVPDYSLEIDPIRNLLVARYNRR